MNNMGFLESIGKKFEIAEQQKVEIVRRNAQKSKRLKKWYDKILFLLYLKVVDLVAFNQKVLQLLINNRNKYSETYVVHDSTRIFAEMMQGDQLDVLKELQVIGARKIDESRFMISFGTYEDEITPTGVKKKQSANGMFVVVEAVLDTDIPFLKVGMDTWDKEADKLPNE